jgi:hypothetical protein
VGSTAARVNVGFFTADNTAVFLFRDTVDSLSGVFSFNTCTSFVVLQHKGLLCFVDQEAPKRVV